jgi:hypothetical protein
VSARLDNYETPQYSTESSVEEKHVSVGVEEEQIAFAGKLVLD